MTTFACYKIQIFSLKRDKSHSLPCSFWGNPRGVPGKPGSAYVPTIFLLQKCQSKTSALARPNSFISFLTTSNQVSLSFPSWPRPLAFPLPILFFFPHHSTKPPQPVSFQNRPIVSMPTLSCNSALVFFSLKEAPHIHPPNHLHLCPLQHRFMPHLHCL